jgi:hypothetical protein
MLANLLRKEASRALPAAARGGIPTWMRGRGALYRGFARSTAGTTKTVLYRPQSRLYFKDGRCLLATVRMRGYFLFLFGATTFCFILVVVSMRKLWRFSDRSYFGLFFYGLMGALSFLGLNSMRMHGKSLITKVWLNKSGKSVLMRKGFFFNIPKEVPIRDIQLPEVVPPELMMESFSNVAYPVVVQGELLWMLKETERTNLEVFAAVFNGHEIDTSEEANEIVIE